jgi:Ca2+-binding EF-hand superfamily protein
MISDIDNDGNGSIEFSEFLEMMTGKMGEKDTREDIEKVFKLFDDDSTSKITFKNLARVAEELGETIDDEELQERRRLRVDSPRSRSRRSARLSTSSMLTTLVPSTSAS